MSNTTVNLLPKPIGKGFRELDWPVDGGSHLYTGSLISQLTSTGMLVPGSTASSGAAVGVASHEVDNTGSDGDKRCKLLTDGVFVFANGTDTDACSEATALFSVVYMVDDHTVADNSASSTRQAAGLFMGMEPDGGVRVYVGWRLGAAADAAAIAIADAGLFTTAADVEAALQELYQNAVTAQGKIDFPLTSFVLKATGAPLGAFDDGNADGFDYDEGVSYRFNPGSTAAIAATVPAPQDLDDSANIVLHALGARIGAEDTTAVLTVECFFQVVGSAYDADTNAGGNTSAFDGATKVVTEETLTIAAADVPAAPNAISITLVPSAALDADDLRVIAVWAEYKKKLLTA